MLPAVSNDPQHVLPVPHERGHEAAATAATLALSHPPVPATALQFSGALVLVSTIPVVAASGHRPQTPEMQSDTEAQTPPSGSRPPLQHFAPVWHESGHDVCTTTACSAWSQPPVAATSAQLNGALVVLFAKPGSSESGHTTQLPLMHPSSNVHACP